jgi:hypothetical protein
MFLPLRVNMSCKNAITLMTSAYYIFSTRRFSGNHKFFPTSGLSTCILSVIASQPLGYAPVDM